MKKQKFKDIIGKRWYMATANALKRIGKDNIGLHQDYLERHRKNVVDCTILGLYFESMSGTGYDKNSIVDKKRVDAIIKRYSGCVIGNISRRTHVELSHPSSVTVGILKRFGYIRKK